jgi:hypothetical protein
VQGGLSLHEHVASRWERGLGASETVSGGRRERPRVSGLRRWAATEGRCSLEKDLSERREWSRRKRSHEARGLSGRRMSVREAWLGQDPVDVVSLS